jgi:UDP-N-acetylmuramyl-tripeptide synthetase
MLAMGKTMLDINELIDRLDALGLYAGSAGLGEKNTAESITYDSRNAQPGSLFVCKGLRCKEDYLREAVRNGAKFYMAEKLYDVPGDVGAVVVSDVRKALAVASALYCRFGEGAITLNAVTGTKGKSTSVYFLKNILEASGRKTAYTTTVDSYDGIETNEAILTTPESDVLHGVIRRAKDNGCSDIVLEVSSQSAKMKRIFGLAFDYGIYLNISDDHISPNEHRDFEEYLACKMAVVSLCRHAVLNMDDAHFGDARKAAENAEAVLTYALENPAADVYAEDIVKNGFTTYFTIVTPEYRVKTHTVIPGVFNVSNALSAAAAAYMQGVPKESIAEGIRVTKVPGRMNIFSKNGYTAVVDYAHNKTSLDHARAALKAYYPDKTVKLVFGCPGSKALQRRHDMAYIASRYAAYVYVTSEDPSHDDPYELAGIVADFLKKYGCPSEIIVDRRAAVQKAVREMRLNDIVIIAGKGSEHYQVVKGVAEPYEGDTVLAERYINMYK